MASEETKVSKCCGAAVKVDSDGHPSSPFVTCWYACSECGQPIGIHSDTVESVSAQRGEGPETQTA